jgi:hypothetical protein
LWVIITHEPQPAVPGGLYTVTEFSACQGLDENSNPVGVSKTFSPTEKQIFSCGYLQTNQPISLVVFWHFEDELLLRDVMPNVQGHFVSRIDAANGDFSEGNYEIQLVIAKAVVWHTKFRIE